MSQWGDPQRWAWLRSEAGCVLCREGGPIDPRRVRPYGPGELEALRGRIVAALARGAQLPLMAASPPSPASPVPAPAERSGLALAVRVGLSLLAGVVGGLATRSSVSTWYPTLQKPAFNPPPWVFGPVWTTLYVLMGVAAWLAWRAAGRGPARERGQRLFWVQLALNVLWSFLFFGLRSPPLALVEILLLWAAIFATLRAFWRVRPLAGALLLPYLAWVSFATLLNASIAWLNR
jgi:translocator protein